MSENDIFCHNEGELNTGSTRITFNSLVIDRLSTDYMHGKDLTWQAHGNVQPYLRTECSNSTTVHRDDQYKTSFFAKLHL